LGVERSRYKSWWGSQGGLLLRGVQAIPLVERGHPNEVTVGRFKQFADLGMGLEKNQNVMRESKPNGREYEKF